MIKQEQLKVFEQTINKEYGNIAGIMVQKDGGLLFEHYFNGCTAASKVHIYSVTKSIVSILIGIAIDKGYIKSINQNILDFFPEYTIKEKNLLLQTVTLKDLMTMTVPYKYDPEDQNSYIKYFTGDDYLAFALNALDAAGEIGQFHYAPLIGPDIFTGILVRATGQSVLDFASAQLFSPLGITVERSIVFQNEHEQFAFNSATSISGWVTDPTGLHTGGWGLTLSPADLTKLGQLYLNNGTWNGKQIVSADWVIESTKEHSRWEALNLPYGYLWWLPEEASCFAAMGDGGNIIYADPKHNLVISITALFIPDAKNSIELIKNYIEPVFIQ